MRVFLIHVRDPQFYALPAATRAANGKPSWAEREGAKGETTVKETVTFSDLLEDAQTNNLIRIKKDLKSGSYVITGFAQPVA